MPNAVAGGGPGHRLVDDSGRRLEKITTRTGCRSPRRSRKFWTDEQRRQAPTTGTCSRTTGTPVWPTARRRPPPSSATAACRSIFARTTCDGPRRHTWVKRCRSLSHRARPESSQRDAQYRDGDLRPLPLRQGEACGAREMGGSAVRDRRRQTGSNDCAGEADTAPERLRNHASGNATCARERALTLAGCVSTHSAYQFTRSA